MTHPLTPREKVAEIIDGALNSAIPEPWEVANHATDAILTALASGSGDHAELARLADLLDLYAAAREDEFTVEDVQLIDRGSGLISALLAEIAALREKVRTEIKLSVDNYVRATARATEAERKLAEADRKVEDLTSALRSIAEGNLGDMPWQRENDKRRPVSAKGERGRDRHCEA